MTISARNEKIFYVTESISGLIFHMPVWVAYELQFISLSQLALAVSIKQAAQLLSELPTGAIADLLGKRVSILIGKLISIFGIFLYLFISDFQSLVVIAIISGIADSFVSGAKDALVYDSLKVDNRHHLYAKISSKASLIFQLSFAAAIFLGGALSILGLRVAIAASILAEIVGLVVSFWFIEPSIDTEKFTLPRYLKQFRNGFTELFKSPYVRDISLFYIGVGGITWSAMMIFNTSLLTTIGYTTLQIGIMVALVRIINSTVLFGALHLKTLVTKRRAYLFFPILIILCYLPGLFLTKELAALAVAVSIFVSSARWVILGGYVNEHYSSENRATALSTLSMLVALAVVASTLISSVIMDAFGGVKAMYTFLGIIGVIFVLPLGLRIRSRYHTPATV